MYSYECIYCGDPLCPELCGEARAAQQKWVNSEEYKEMIENVRKSRSEDDTLHR